MTATLGRIQARDVAGLAKPGLTRMVVLTSGLGLWVAPGTLDLWTTLATLIGTTLVVASANTFNSLVELDSDALMERTRDRPLPSGRLQPEVALFFGGCFLALGFPILLAGAGPLPALLAAIAHISYVFIYTPLKKVSAVSTLVGAVPGALPPVIGWAAATGEIGTGGVVLFSLLFVWQMPHFFAISLVRQAEYRAAGLRVYPLVHGEQATLRHMLVYAALLLPISLLPTALGLAGLVYGGLAALAGTAYLYVVAKAVAGSVPGDQTDRTLAGGAAPGNSVVRPARLVFLGSLLHLTLLMLLLLVDAG